MGKIKTGFKIKPLVGSLERDQLLIRYFPKNRFVQLLENKGLWFNRTYVWKDMDACEANLLPSYKKYIRKSLKDEAESNYLQAMMEFNLSADLGCCFTLYDSSESYVMWRSYTPEPDYGVAIVIRAKALVDTLSAISNTFKNVYLSKVKYLTDQQAKVLTAESAIHSRTKKGDLQWDLVECHFYKRDAYSAEKEVRAVVQSNDSWTDLFNKYVDDNSIIRVPANTPTPTDQPYFRVDARNNMDLIIPSDFSVFLSIEKAINLTNYVKEFGVTHLQSSGVIFPSGGYFPFDFTTIEKIVLHPALASDLKGADFYRELANDYKLNTEITQSVLYTETW